MKRRISSVGLIVGSLIVVLIGVFAMIRDGVQDEEVVFEVEKVDGVNNVNPGGAMPLPTYPPN